MSVRISIRKYQQTTVLNKVHIILYTLIHIFNDFYRTAPLSCKIEYTDITDFMEHAKLPRIFSHPFVQGKLLKSLNIFEGNLLHCNKIRSKLFFNFNDRFQI